MKRVLFFILLMSVWRSVMWTQTNDSAYYFKCVDNNTKENIPFAVINISSNGIKLASGTTDLNGVAKIISGQMGSSIKVNVKTQYVGFKAKEIKNIQLKINDTLSFALHANGIEFNEILITSYQVPLIDPDTKPKKKLWKKRRKETTAVVDTAICYTNEEMADYKMLTEGKWFLSDTINNKLIHDFSAWFKELQKSIRYPERAREWGIQGRVYFSITIDELGVVKNKKMLYGREPILALEVARHFVGLHQIKLQQDYNANKLRYPVEFKFAFKFNLR